MVKPSRRFVIDGKKKRNSSKAKIVYRSRIARLLSATADVLECFAGEGHIYRMCWSPFSGATIDKDTSAVRDAARERPGWSVYQGDTARALTSGWMDHRSFDVVDVDCYGEPWPFVAALFAMPRQWPAQWWLVCTDGYMSQRNIAKASKTLFGETKGGSLAGVSENEVILATRHFVRRFIEESGQHLVGALSFAPSHGVGKIWTHVFLVQNEPTKTAELEAMQGWAFAGRTDAARRR